MFAKIDNKCKPSAANQCFRLLCQRTSRSLPRFVPPDSCVSSFSRRDRCRRRRGAETSYRLWTDEFPHRDYRTRFPNRRFVTDSELPGPAGEHRRPGERVGFRVSFPFPDRPAASCSIAATEGRRQARRHPAAGEEARCRPVRCRAGRCDHLIRWRMAEEAPHRPGGPVQRRRSFPAFGTRPSGNRLAHNRCNTSLSRRTANRRCNTFEQSNHRGPGGVGKS